MKKILIYSFVLVNLVSCTKEVTTVQQEIPIKQPLQLPQSKPFYRVIITNHNPNGKTITGFYIDNVLQKLDVGNYPVKNGDSAFALNHVDICPVVKFPNGCLTELKFTFGGDVNVSFNKFYIYRLRYNGRIEEISSSPVTTTGFSMIWNYSNNSTSTSGINSWGNGTVPSKDIWTEPILISAY